MQSAREFAVIRACTCRVFDNVNITTARRHTEVTIGQSTETAHFQQYTFRYTDFHDAEIIFLFR
jgi:hypothetical protein